MKLSQKIFLWLWFILWTVTLFIWYAADSLNWGFTNFLQATIFWGIVAALTHLSLKSKETPDAKNRILLRKIERLPKTGKEFAMDGFNLAEKLEATDKLPQEKIDNLKNTFAEGMILELYGRGAKLIDNKEYQKASDLAAKIIGMIIDYENIIYGFEPGTIARYIKDLMSFYEKAGNKLTIKEIRDKHNEIKRSFIANNSTEKLPEVLDMINNLQLTHCFPQLSSNNVH